MGPGLRLGLAAMVCLALLAGALTRPLGVRSAVRAYDRAPEDDPALRRALQAKGEQAVPALIQQALDPGCRSRGRIVALLKDIDAEQAQSAFEKGLKDSRPEQRARAEEALSLLGDI